MSTQTEAVIARIRDFLMRGVFAPGAKLAEIHLAKQLGVSRTPVRLALGELAREGILDYEPNRGFVAKGFTIKDVMDAFAIRERLESMAAGIVAEQGIADEHLEILESCVRQGNELLHSSGGLTHADVRIWSEINGKFHTTIVEAANNGLLCSLLARVENIPLAAAKSFAGTYNNLDVQRDVIAAAQSEHRWVIDAITEKDRAWAEYVMRQHVHNGKKKLGQVLEALRSDSSINSDPRLRLDH